MAEDSNRKRQLLRLLRYLEEMTDEKHQKTTQELIEAISYQGSADTARKALRSDIKLLLDEGFSIERERGHAASYYYNDRKLSDTSVKILTDAVQGSGFFSPEESDWIAKSLTEMVSMPTGDAISDQVFFSADWMKPPEEDADRDEIRPIADAIRWKKKIHFQYYDYDLHKQRVLRHGGQVYSVSPFGFVWSNDRYYLIGIPDGAGADSDAIRVYRADRIVNAERTTEAAVPMPESFDIREYVRESFKMFHGEEETQVTLECDAEVMRSIIDKFGISTETEPVSEDVFLAHVKVGDSPVFYGWVLQWDGKVRIKEPEQAVRKYREILERALSQVKSDHR